MSYQNSANLPTYADISAAEARITRHVEATPVRQLLFDGYPDIPIHVKCENLQKTGSFKFRGALHAIQAAKALGAKGIVSHSSGNFSKALAFLAHKYKLPSIFAMPWDTTPHKIAETRALGAHVEFINRQLLNEEEFTRNLAQENNYEFIDQYDNPHVLAGAGTAAYELFQEVGRLDFLFVPIGSGVLAASSTLVADRMSPHCHVVGVVTEGLGHLREYLKEYPPQRFQAPATLATGLWARRIGAYSFPLLRDRLADIVTVSDEEMLKCMGQVHQQLGMKVELAACLSGYP